jgi:Kef-type K+ transport system membrane component KefB
MKRILLFILFFIIGFIAAIALVYLSGYFAVEFGIALYESEYDQQRNFNIAIVFTFLFALFSGIIGSKKFT